MSYELINAIITTTSLFLVIAGVISHYAGKNVLAVVLLAPVCVLAVSIAIGAFVKMWISAIG
jgi:hypothetical protein